MSCPTTDTTSPYDVSLCMQQESRGHINADPWAPELGGNVPSPSPTPHNQNVADAIYDGTMWSVAILAILIIVIAILFIATTREAHGKHSR